MDYYSQLSDEALFSMLNILLLDLRSQSQQSFETYKRARKAFLLKYHPDKGPITSVEEERVKKVNGLWGEYTQRYGDASPSPNTTPQTTPTERFTQTFPDHIRALFLNAIPTTQSSCFFVLAPYPDLVPLRREVEKVKLDDLFLGKRENGTGILGFMVAYRMPYRTLCKKVDNVCKRGSDIGVCRPKRYKDVKRYCFDEFPEGAEAGCLQAEEEEEPLFDHTMLRDLAMDLRITDPVYLHGLYCHEMPLPLVDCQLCVEDGRNREEFQTHRPYHIKHHENSICFRAVREQRKACVHACDAVHAYLRLRMKTQSPVEFYIERLKEVLSPVAKGDRDTRSVIAQGVLWSHMCPGVFKTFIEKVYNTIVVAQPKKRGLILQGPFDCGKTTLAQSIRAFYLGSSLNVNLCKDRLHFELGGAIDMRMVLFDDVTGAATNGLEGGWGFRNLDSLRDHLDGCVPVGLERKHQQRIEQVFPPWILTCNEYKIPPAILARGELIKLRKSIVDPDAFMEKYKVRRSQLVSAESYALAMALYLPVDFFPESCKDLVEMIKADAREHQHVLEAELLDLECHEEMPPSPPPRAQEELPETPCTDSNPLLNFIYQINKRLRDEGEDAGEGPSGVPPGQRARHW